MRFYPVFTVIWLAGVLGVTAGSPKSTTSDTASKPVVPVQAQDSSAPAAAAPTPPSASSTMQPMEKSYPPRQEAWELPVQLDEQIQIKKIYDFLNDRSVNKAGKNQELAFEFKYYDGHAVTEEQKASRKGHYYTVSWANHGPAADFTLRFDYRQAHSPEKVTTQEIAYKSVAGTVKGEFSVTGRAYAELGDSVSWRVSVVRNGKIVAQSTSFVW